MHEFGHALACRSVGGRADQIVLWPLGGVAYVDPPQRPGAVLWSIAAGPLVNVVLLVVLTVFGMLNRSFGWLNAMPDVHGLVLAVWYINFGLLIFNLLPVYPLDGGQILRALLWFAFGRARSLMMATIIGFVGVAGIDRAGGVVAVDLDWHTGGVHPDELLARLAASAGVVASGQRSAPRRVRLSVLQSGAAGRSVLGLWPVPQAVRHIHDARRLSALQRAIRRHALSGVRRIASAERVGRFRNRSSSRVAGSHFRSRENRTACLRASRSRLEKPEVESSPSRSPFALACLVRPRIT